MGCEIIRTDVPAGWMVICGRGVKPPKPCADCGAASAVLCDGCDRPFCRGCVNHLNPDLDFCRDCSPLMASEKLRRALLQARPATRREMKAATEQERYREAMGGNGS
jgi:hypothetical protein